MEIVLSRSTILLIMWSASGVAWEAELLDIIDRGEGIGVREETDETGGSGSCSSNILVPSRGMMIE